ncbi:sigma 54-interacting transcriptional regulator [Desulfobacterales bacterium HSG17]|nr:sigma 54-interacting transcriptional regulator [Desulfobacterales bacterium HSG17]
MDKILTPYIRLASIFDFLSIGSIILANDRKIVSMNETARMLTETTHEKVKGKFCHEIFSDHFCTGKCLFDEAVQKGQDALTDEIEINDMGHKYHLTKIAFPVYDNNQKLYGCIEVIQDHSAFRDLMERIRYEGHKMKMILDNLDIGVMTVDRRGYVTFFNAAAELITQYTRQDVLGKSCAAIFGNQKFDEHLPLYETIKHGATISRQEGKILTKQGQAVPIRANYMALKNETDRIIGGLATLSDLSLMYQFNSEINARYTFYDMVGKAPSMQKIFDILPVISESDATVLIEGATGTGKDIMAKVIHNASKRAGRALVKVNCAALPDNLLESEMFGYVKGAFTGADRDKTGRFQEADKGTIFLDEIGDLPLSLQAKLLTVLEDKEFYPLGSRKTTKVDVRIISATNLGLEQQVKEKQFREDLFYRLNVMRLELPALKDRKEDLPILISHILKRLCAKKNIHMQTISEQAMETLLNHDYPGNIRELENILEHALIICQTDVIDQKHLPLSLRNRSINRQSSVPNLQKNQYENLLYESPEKQEIIKTLEKYNWNKGQTAKALDINRSTLWRKMKKFGIFLKS